MLNNVFKLAITICVLVTGLFILPQHANAQVCGGSWTFVWDEPTCVQRGLLFECQDVETTNTAPCQLVSNQCVAINSMQSGCYLSADRRTCSVVSESVPGLHVCPGPYYPPSCGDGVCNGSETYLTCPGDNCPAPPPNSCASTYDSPGWCQADGCGCGQRSILRIGTAGNVCSNYCVPDAACSCSPGNTAPVGANDGQIATPGVCQIAGWACDADNYNTALGVAAYEGGTFLSFGTANINRPDLVSAGVCGGTGNHGFALSLPVSIQDGNTHYITMETQGVLPGGAGEPAGTSLSNNPRPVVCSPASCTITTNPPGIVNVSVGGVVNFTATLAASEPAADEMRFIVNDPTRASATSPVGSINHPSYVSQVQGLALGSTTIIVEAYRGGVLCGSVAGGVQVNVVPPTGWYQILNGDVFASSVANLVSPIPDTCVGACSPYLITGTFPGIAFYGGTTFDASANPSTTGSVSTNNWVGNTSYGGKTYTYADFASLVPSTITPNTISGGVTENTIRNSGVADSAGYEWHQATSDITLTQPITIPANERIVILAQGNVTINGNITMVQPRSSHFMIASSGNISVSPTVTALDGVFFSQGTFSTGTGGSSSDSQLRVRGSVYAGNVTMQRDLGAGNATNPGEIFEFMPELFVTYHPFLSPKKVIWKEVSP